MRNTILLIFFSICFLSSFSQQDDQKKEVDKFITNWHNAAARADSDAYFGAIDEDGIYIGTDKTERWTKQEFFNWSKKYFDAGKAWSFTGEDRHICFSEDGKTSWFDEVIDNGTTKWRGSGVLVKKKDGWKIMQYVLSVPVPNEVYKEVEKIILNFEDDQE
jgi:ketosteroid isomerase-like protein